MNFEKEVTRRHTNSVKWDEAIEKHHNENLLPMWVADMDFLPFEEVRTGLSHWAQTSVHGYAAIPETLIAIIQKWQKERFGLEVAKEAIVFSSGVVPSISIAIQALTKEGDAVLIHNPVYPPFARSVKLNKRKLIEQPLLDENGHYTLDLEAFERKICEENVKLFIFCNPHNPGGRVWQLEEIAEIGQICKKHGVLVVSDEIHEDIVFAPNVHTSFATAGEDFANFSITLTSATKTFNLAGIKNSMMFIENPFLRDKIRLQLLTNNQHEIATIGLIGTELAYTYGKEWLNALLVHLEKNRTIIEKELIAKSKVRWHKPEGTYLCWLDFSAYNFDDATLEKKLLEKGEIMLNSGISFGSEGSGFMRLNLATTSENVHEAVKRILKAVA